jgi:hypothetical protein
LIYVFHLKHIVSSNLKKEIQYNSKDKLDMKKLVQCKLCQEMFEFEFNYEDILKSKLIDIIKKTFETIEQNKDELKNYFSKDNMEFTAKEISMQYFFKGGESQIDELNSLKFKECKFKRIDECNEMKLGACEKILSFDEGMCINMKNKIKNFILNSNSKRDDVIKPLLPGKIDENIINFKKLFFKQKENFIGDDKDPEVIKKFGDISLIELTPEYIEKNFDSSPKSHWRPPKPVLLANFEGNIGNQLKDISGLAR